jgi:hypothetical protein
VLLKLAQDREPVEPGQEQVGYRDVGEDVRHTRAAISRAWVFVAIMAVLYLAWTLTVFFIEPGLR